MQLLLQGKILLRGLLGSLRVGVEVQSQRMNTNFRGIQAVAEITSPGCHSCGVNDPPKKSDGDAGGHGQQYGKH